MFAFACLLFPHYWGLGGLLGTFRRLLRYNDHIFSLKSCPKGIWSLHVPKLTVAVAALLLFVPIGGHAQATTTAVVPTSTATAIGLGTVTEYTLPNGLQVLIAPSNAADLVTMDVWVGAGTRRETADTNGVAHFMEHLIFKGTPTRKPGEIDAAIEDLGGSLNAATSYDWAHFYGTVDVGRRAGTPWRFLSDAVMNAEMRQEDIDAEKPVILNEMAREADSATQRVEPCVQCALLHRPILMGVLCSEPRTTSRKCRARPLWTFTTRITRRAMPPGFWPGKISPEDGLALAQKTFGVWPSASGSRRQSRCRKPPQTDIRTRSMTAPVRRGFLQIGWRAPSVQGQARMPGSMDVMMTLLGQGGNNRLEADLLRQEKAGHGDQHVVSDTARSGNHERFRRV